MCLVGRARKLRTEVSVLRSAALSSKAPLLAMHDEVDYCWLEVRKIYSFASEERVFF